jgi:hypothetical protein
MADGSLVGMLDSVTKTVRRVWRHEGSAAGRKVLGLLVLFGGLQEVRHSTGLKALGETESDCLVRGRPHLL